MISPKDWIRNFFLTRRNAYRDCFKGLSGEYVIADLAKFCNWNTAIPPGSAESMAYEEGKRRVFLRVRAQLMLTDERIEDLISQQIKDANSND